MREFRLYMDVCCLNRPFDDQFQDRIRLESEAILTILAHCESGEWTLAASDIIDMELLGLTNHEKLEKIRGLYSIARSKITVRQEVRDLARLFQQGGVKLVDSLHMALCESYRVDVLLTTDDSFIKAAARLNRRVRVVNPITWLMEVTGT